MKRTVGKNVYVLGAGFSHALVPEMPLGVGEFGGVALRAKFTGFPHASAILRAEEVRTERAYGLSGAIDVERLLTRLDHGMPFDEGVADAEIALLRHEVEAAFVGRLREGRDAIHEIAPGLAAFARHCVESGSVCVTFNYDDLLDRGLWEVARVVNIPKDVEYWHPDGGYGFFCEPASSAIGSYDTLMDRCATELLKLHGSLNWRVRRGTSRPYAVGAVVHSESWLPQLHRVASAGEQPPLGVEYQSGFALTKYELPTEEEGYVIENHLEPRALIVPPVLDKTSEVMQPIMRVIWARAAAALRGADHVVFIGYSMPATDLAAQDLFAECLADAPAGSVRIVLRDGPRFEERVRSYTSVVPTLKPEDFERVDAAAWLNERAIEWSGTSAQAVQSS